MAATAEAAIADAHCRGAGIAAVGVLAQDWAAERFAGLVPPGPRVALKMTQNPSYLLSITPRADEVQFAAPSGGLLGPVLDDATGMSKHVLHFVPPTAIVLPEV